MYIEKLIQNDTLGLRAYMCGKCSKLYDFDQLKSAEDCCKPVVKKCSDCERILGEREPFCLVCHEFNQVKRAKHITVDDYEGQAVFTDDAPDGEEGMYFHNDLYQACDDNAVDPPCYVYACTETKFGISPEEIHALFESACDNLDEDAHDRIVGEDDVYDFFKKWNEAQTSYYCEPDYKTVIVLDDERFQKYLQKNDKKNCSIN